MAQSAVTVRMDSEMKTQFDALCEQFYNQGLAKCAGLVYAAKERCGVEQGAGTLA